MKGRHFCHNIRTPHPTNVNDFTTSQLECQAVVHHKRGQTIKFLHKTKEQLFSFSMILFLNRNDEKWPHTRQIKIAGRNHILPPLGICMENV